MKTNSVGFGLIGLLISLVVMMALVWYSLRLLQPQKGTTGVNPASDGPTIIEAARQAKKLLENAPRTLPD